MAFFVLMGLIAVLVVYISIAKKKKWALIISIVILGGFHFYVRYTCGPNSADVKVMKPMAEKISDYIVKNGIPKSLKDIPDLPYKINCEIKHEDLFEKCTYTIGKKKYNISFSGGLFLHIDTDKYNGMTRVSAYYNKNENEKIFLDEPISAYLVFATGICSTMKQ